VAQARAEVHRRPYVSPKDLEPDLARAREVGRELLETLLAMPLVASGRPLFVVVSPGNQATRERLEQAVGEAVDVVVSDDDAVARLLRQIETGAPVLTRRKLTGRERRRDTRREVTIGITCRYSFYNRQGLDLFQRTFLGKLRDVSIGGACISGTLPLRERNALRREDVIIKCHIEAPHIGTAEEPLRTEGRVRWLGRPGGDRVQFGVSWVPTFPEDHPRLEDLVELAARLEAELEDDDDDDDEELEDFFRFEIL
jgi:hypothetical protein